MAVDEDFAILMVVVSEEEMENRGFATTRLSNQGWRGPRLTTKQKAIQ